jgi:hypothetical protein
LSLAERKLRAEKRVEKIRQWREKKGIEIPNYSLWQPGGKDPDKSATRKNKELPWYLTLLGCAGFIPANVYTEPKKKKLRLIKVPVKQ